MTFFRFRTKQEKEREIALKQETLHLELENLEKDFRIFLFDRMNMRQMKVDACGEQFAFRQMRTDDFFSSQTIREYRDRTEKNALYTKNFKHAFEAFVDGKFSEAKIYCKSLRRKTLMWLLYAELEFYFSIHEKALPSKSDLALVFNIAEKNFDKFVRKVHEKLPKAKFSAKSYTEFAEFKRSLKDYSMFNIKNIAVCATMSAGKSTFVNALLGRDVLPARNEATTAKITSVYDKDGAEKMVGYATKNGKITEQSADVTLEVINKWNSSNNIERIYLQGDLDGIKNDGFVVAVHDTPGTNNSGDKSHHEVTMDFLQNNKMDALIFVANATQLCTNDERILLSELLQVVIEPTKIPVLFILNKADELDEEKESIEDIQKRYVDYLKEIGFKEPKLFLLSAKAARLLKMAKNGRTENLTAREKSDLKAAIAEFTDLHDFSGGGERKCESEIETALLRSGLQNVEKYIESLF